jgi:hypothetical protein
MVKKSPGRKWPNGHSQNRRFGEIVYYFEIIVYRAIRIFTPALVLVIGGADEIYGVALL